MLSAMLRVILFLASVGITLWVMYKIRKSKAKVEDALYWILFALMLILLSVFPQIAFFLSGVLGVQAPVNFVFLMILFALIVKVFMLSLRISQLESKLQDFAQRYAIEHAEDEGKT